MEESRDELTAGNSEVCLCCLLTLFLEQGASTAGLFAVFHSIHVAARGRAAPRIDPKATNNKHMRL